MKTHKLLTLNEILQTLIENIEAGNILLESKKKKRKRWIQKAIKKKGSLRALAKKLGKIDSKGNIDTDWLRQQAKKNTKTGKRARLALTLKKLRKK